MIDQATFLKLNSIFGSHLIITAFLEELKSRRAIRLYQELIQISMEEEEIILLVSYKYFENKLNYSRESIRKALEELQNAKLIKKSPMHVNNVFSIELNHDFWVKNLKGIL
jgi:hypothetical protein